MAIEDDTASDPTTRTSLRWLVGARLLLAGLSLGLAIILDRLDGNHGNPAIWGVYWTVVAAFTATIVSALMAPRTRNPNRFATVQVGIDVGIVTALVYFSGGGDSVCTFLYALVVLYGALVLDRTGVGLSAALAAGGYAFVLFGAELGLLPDSSGQGREHSLIVLGAYWGFYAGALLVLGMLANTLSAELRRTGAALDRRTHDLRRLRDLHLRTVESIGSGLVTTDDEGRITSFNPEAERISGVSGLVAEGQFLDDVIPGAAAIIDSHEAPDTEDHPPGRNRIPFQRSDGEELFLGLGTSSLYAEDGTRLGQVVIFQDVTQVVSMEHELRQSERLAAVGEMAARMAHEIRNPLAAISGSVQVLQNSESPTEGKSETGPEHERLMGIVVREVDRLNDLIGDFLLYSRPAPLRTESVCLASLVEEVAKMSEGAPRDDISIELNLDASVEVTADRAQLASVVWNLWNNALEAMSGAGRLRVNVLRQTWVPPQGRSTSGRNAEGDGLSDGVVTGWQAVLEIEDTGGGISPEVRERIFEPFYTTKPEGTGLGLATVQRIIEQHGGSIQISSEMDERTTFRVQLPGAGAPA